MTDFPALSEVQEAEALRFTEPVSASIEAHWIATLLEVNGNVKSAATLSCSRCLKDYQHDLRGYFSLTFTREMPDIENLDELEDDELDVELSPDDLGLVHAPGEQIDLHDTVAEQVLLALPVRPLCDEHCLGLCPGCGQDLNVARCGCEKPIFNHKFAALKKLKIDQE